jgi:hypothetical protein
MSAGGFNRTCIKLTMALVLVGLIGLLSSAKAEAAYIGWFDYDRNGTNTNGTLTWKWTIDDFPPVYSVSWRGGSGSNYDDHTNGFLPSGWYSVKGHWNNYDANINGRVWWLSNKVDSGGCCLRTEFFINTEETPSNGQGSIESERWDGPSDYLSLGCVKVSYGNIPAVHTRWANYGGCSTHGSGSPYPLASKLHAHN